MARQKNMNGTRQLALKALKEMTTLTRAQMLDNLHIMFPQATTEYLKTLWATHRLESKEDGSLVEVFSIQDSKNGKSCDPYLKTEWAYNPQKNKSLSIQVAKIRYKNDLAARLQIAQEIL